MIQTETNLILSNLEIMKKYAELDPNEEERIYRGVVYDTSYIERIMIILVVRDVNVERTVQAIINKAQTGEIGDGRIFITPVEDSIRIRTGERGDISLYDVK
jgi:nitrogen regulatory protein P-II 1